MNILLEAVNLEYLFGSTTNLAVLPEHKGKLFTLEKCKKCDVTWGNQSVGPLLNLAWRCLNMYSHVIRGFKILKYFLV